MEWIEPTIKSKISPLPRLEYDVVDSILLDGFDSDNATESAFFSVLETRESRRTCYEIDSLSLGKLLFLSSRVKSSGISSDRLQVQKRNVPSSGGLHAIDCFVSKSNSNDWYVYNPSRHTLDRLRLSQKRLIEFHRNECFNILPEMQGGYLIWYVCDIERMRSKYENPESLAYRDSGVLSGIQSLIAESLGFAFCMVGRLGYKEAAGFSNKRDLIGVGSAIVGGRLG